MLVSIHEKATNQAQTELEVQKIRSEISKIENNNQEELGKAYLRLKKIELQQMKDDKDCDIRYLLAKEALSMSMEQSKALSTAFGNARIIGNISDFPHLEKIIRSFITIREIIAESINLLDDEMITGIGRFLRGVSTIRKEAQASKSDDKFAEEKQTDKAQSQQSSNFDGSSFDDKALPPIPNDSNFDN